MDAWYEGEVRELEARPRPPARSCILFYGGSSIRLWDRLADDFRGHSVINRGFGGSTLGECVDCFDRLVRPVAPRAMLVYAGDNDLSQGVSADTVMARFRRFVALVGTLPPTPWAFVSVKLSPSRRHLADEIRRFNRMAETEIRALPNAAYIDVFTPMSDERAGPPFKYYTDDWLHLNRAGYELWARVIDPWIKALPGRTSTAGHSGEQF